MRGASRRGPAVDRPSAATGWAAILAGLGWIAKDLGGRLSPDPDYWNCNSSYDYALNAADTVAFLFLVPALIGLLHSYSASTAPPLGFAAPGSAVGYGGAGVANLLEHCAGMDVLGFVYVIGSLLGIMLLLVFSVALTRARLLPSWTSWLLVGGTAAGLLFANQGGLVLFGLAWVVVGLVVLNHQSPPKRPHGRSATADL
jgi:hypothetical protein